MRTTLTHIAHRVLLDGDELRRSGSSLTAYYQQIGVPASTVASATAGLGMSRQDDPLRIFVTREKKDEPALAFGPSAGLVLGVSIGHSSIRAALVDANGHLHHPHPGEALVGQLGASPETLFERIRTLGELVLDDALGDQRLLVNGALPLLAVAVAWPGPLDRNRGVPRVGLAHPGWRVNDLGIDQRLARHLGVPEERSHAIDNATAGALAVGFDHTRATDYGKQRDSRPLMVVRIGGGISASNIVVKPVRDGHSGWMRSTVTTGDRGLAGQIGHVPVNRALLEELKAYRPDYCPDPKPVSCSCAEPGEMPEHIEAYASCPAVAARFGAESPEQTAVVIREVRAQRSDPPQAHALGEVGTLVADALLPSVLMLNPHSIELTGGLAIPEVEGGVEAQFEKFGALGRIFGGAPTVSALEGEENEYVRVRGAALSVLRERVHRRIDVLFGADQDRLRQRFAELTEPIRSYPWADAPQPDPTLGTSQPAV